MGDQWEARISAIENILEEFGHDIREVKEHLARLPSLFEDRIKTQTMHFRGQSPSLNQQVPRPFVRTTSYLPRRTNRPNLRQPRPTASPAFKTTSRPTDLLSASRGKPNGQKIEKKKPWWDPIPICYTELFPKLVRSDHIEPVQFAPLGPPFPRWYNAHTRCDYRGGNPGHPTKNCTSLKSKVQELINDGKLTFEDLDGPTEVKDPFRTKVDMAKQKEETPKEPNFEKTTMPKEKVPIAKAGSSTTTKGSKERSCKPNGEQEKSTFWDSTQGLERMFFEQNECVTTLIEEHNSRTLKRRRTLGRDEAWGGQTANMKNGNIGINISQDDL